MITKGTGRRFAIGFLLGLAACGGKPRTPVRPTPAIARRPPLPPAPVPPPIAPSDLAPSPSIRVGLVTSAEVVRVSSSAPFEVSAGRETFTTHDLLVEQGRGQTVNEGQVFRVQVASSVDRATAERLAAAASEDAGEKPQVAREAGTGRFAVRLGKFGTEQGALAARENLSRLGYEGLRVVSESSLSTKGPLILRPVQGTTVVTDAPLVTVRPREKGAWVEVEGSPYRGFVEILQAVQRGFTVVNVVNLEDYLKGVVPAELSPEVYPQVEAQKAQAVAARTYALRHMGQFVPEGYDVCATPACQVYRGVLAEHRLSTEAVAGTAGEVIAYEGELADTLYTSTCGGRTEDVENVFSGPGKPYLVSRSCYSEAPAVRLAGANATLGPEEAAAVVRGVVSEEDLAREPLDAPVGAAVAARWIGSALGALGQASCASTQPRDGAVTLGRFGGMLAQLACWESRIPFFVSREDAERYAPEIEGDALAEGERRALAFWIQDQVVRLDGPAGSSRPLTRREAIETLSRFITRRAEPLLTAAEVFAVSPDTLTLRVEDVEEQLALAPRRYFFRRVEGVSQPAASLALLPGDRVFFHRSSTGTIDLLELQATGASFDRSSRFSNWIVRKTSAELSAEVNARERVGEVTDLKPLRYGRSGRVAELSIVGAERTVTLRGLAIRTRLGIRENLFFVDKQAGANGAVIAWVFSGRGWGHGVGLCQVGAYGMAAAGYTYRDILGHYYFQSTLARYDVVPSSPGR